jgi:protein-S-isoprenylcysteine O-methyltransferase Ste14
MGTFLVFLQFALLLLLAAAAGPAMLAGAVSAPAWLLAMASLVLAAWTLAHNRIGNFNIRPMPKAGGRLVTSGPYRQIRHPMYSAVLLGAAALAWLAHPAAWLAWAALCIVLWTKSSIEERWMAQHHPDYAAYRQHSRRFVPWLL